MASNDFTTTELNPCMSKDLPNAEQIDCALNEIGHMAAALESICWQVSQGDKEGDLIVAAANLAAKIGWTADRCCGFDIKSSDSWLMSPVWNQKADKVEVDHI
ncbi:MAG: hypothetical protein HRU78_14330 [Gammaproteobacteria bacterium]|nr:MAG: hypothetical protein HRU78_14330 [Gammaproteobacteria bacterium]